jgi:hypothetical protein
VLLRSFMLTIRLQYISTCGGGISYGGCATLDPSLLKLKIESSNTSSQEILI